MRLEILRQRVGSAIRFAIALALSGSAAVWSQTVYDVSTFAGVMPGSVDGPGGAARFNGLGGLDVDAVGNIYAADTGNHTLRRISPDGYVTTVLGTARQMAGTAPSQLLLANPSSVQVGTAGTLYVAQANQVLRFTAAREVASVLTLGLYLPDFALAADGSIYATDFYANQVWRLPAGDGSFMRVAGSPAGESGSVDGVGDAARFKTPWDVAIGKNGTLYVADLGNLTVRAIDANGRVTTLAGSPGASGVVDGAGAAARFLGPSLIDTDAAGNVYVADGYAVRKVTPAGSVTTFAGRVDEPGLADGNPAVARFFDLAGLAVDAEANVFVSDNDALRRIAPNGMVTTIAGAASRGHANGAPTEVRFEHPTDLVRTAAGITYVIEEFGTAIRKIDAAGTITTFAGSWTETGSADGAGGAARFGALGGIAADQDGNVYVSDRENSTIRKITAAGVVSTLGGQPGIPGNADGTGAAANFSGPAGLDVDHAGNVYVADQTNRLIRKITPAGTVTTMAGPTDLQGPQDLAVDANGVVWVADGAAVRKVAAGGAVTTVADFGPNGGPGDLTIAANGDIYVTDLAYHLIRRVDPAGNVSIIAGAYDQPGAVDGRGASARFSNPRGLHADTSGALLIADTGNAAIRRLTVGTPPVFDTQPQSLALSVGGAQTLTARAGASGVSYAWRHDGATIAGATGASLNLANVQPRDAGVYTVVADNSSARQDSAPAIVGVLTSAKVAGDGRQLTPDVLHPNGNIYDQLLLEGAAASLTADAGQITRISFIDTDDDIVQVEFSGPGTLSLVLDGASASAAPRYYNQEVDYVKGRAGIVIAGADERTNVSVFSVGRYTAVNQSLFKPEVNYDGVADMAYIAILSRNGKFGGVRAGNVRFSAARGVTGVYAPGVQFSGPVFVGGITAFSVAMPVLVTGAATDARITGGNLFQDNGRPVAVHGLSQLRFVDGTDSHGNLRPAQRNLGVLQDGEVNVTSQIVVNP
ncbi:MAG TPA: immunoglobulin domain-containing protein [Opitutus sp.]|nr:immunoglobulin domain-containing protein [Opitutus sp.]